MNIENIIPEESSEEKLERLNRMHEQLNDANRTGDQAFAKELSAEIEAVEKQIGEQERNLAIEDGERKDQLLKDMQSTEEERNAGMPEGERFDPQD